jgi:hypothetical protein
MNVQTRKLYLSMYFWDKDFLRFISLSKFKIYVSNGIYDIYIYINMDKDFLFSPFHFIVKI